MTLSHNNLPTTPHRACGAHPVLDGRPGGIRAARHLDACGSRIAGVAVAARRDRLCGRRGAGALGLCVTSLPAQCAGRALCTRREQRQLARRGIDNRDRPRAVDTARLAGRRFRGRRSDPVTGLPRVRTRRSLLAQHPDSRRCGRQFHALKSADARPRLGRRSLCTASLGG